MCLRIDACGLCDQVFVTGDLSYCNSVQLYGARENGVFLILSFYSRFYMVFSVVFNHLYSNLYRNFNTELAEVFWKSFQSTSATIRRSLV